jgi:hypothetical protein
MDETGMPLDPRLWWFPKNERRYDTGALARNPILQSLGVAMQQARQFHRTSSSLPNS